MPKKDSLNKNKILINFNYLKSHLINKTTKEDYINLDFNNLNQDERNTYLTFGINNILIKENNKSFDYIYQNKKIFEEKYHHFLNYNFLYLKDYLTFKKFITDNSLIKANNKKYKVTEKNVLSVYQELVTNKIKYITNFYEPCHDIKKLNKTNDAFIRFLMYHNNIVNAYLFIPEKNFELFAPINIETGIVDYPALNKNQKIFDKSPDTNENIIWFKVPKWPRVKRYASKISEFYPETKYETIDISITEDAPILLSMNNHPQYYYYQLSSHRSTNYGIMEKINKIRKEEKHEHIHSL